MTSGIDRVVADIDVVVADINVFVADIDVFVADINVFVRDINIGFADIDICVADIDIRFADIDFDVPDVTIGELVRRKCMNRATHRRAWIRPLRGVRRAIDATFRRIDGSCRVIDASERFFERRPVQATRQLQRVSEWLADAAAQLGRAGLRLRITTTCLAAAPEDGAGAPARLVEETGRWIEAAGELTAVSAVLDEVAARVLRRAREAGGLDERPVIAAPRPAARWFLQYCPPQPGDRIRVLLQRRRRPAPALPTDAPRRISSGRAPPFVSTCLL